MAKGTRAKPAGAQRVQRHRDRAERRGQTRVEVTVPISDVDLMRAIAERLRTGGEQAAGVRTAFADVAGHRRARTGKELLAFFRASPAVGVELSIERDPSPGRESEL